MGIFFTVLQTYDLLARHFVRGLLLYSAAVLVITGLVLTKFHFIGESNFEVRPAPAPEQWLPFILVVALYVLVALPLLYLFGRFCLYVLSPPLDQKIGPGESWRRTKGTGRSLFFILLLLHLPFSFITFVLDWTVALTGTLAYAILTGILTIVWIMVSAFGAAVIYRSFVSAPTDTGYVAERPAH